MKGELATYGESAARGSAGGGGEERHYCCWVGFLNEDVFCSVSVPGSAWYAGQGVRNAQTFRSVERVGMQWL